MLPGDFSTTIEKDGAKLGILALNSTFLQLTEDDYKGKLALSAHQFHAACNGDGPRWAADDHVCLLVTHHPPEWLTAESRAELDSEISDPGQFAAHLFGHMHESNLTVIGHGGGLPRCLWQGRSLFGLEKFIGHQGEQLERSHGYSAGRLEIRSDFAAVKFWPRETKRLQNGALKVVPDHSFDLTRDLHTEPIRTPLLSIYTNAGEPPVRNTRDEIAEIRRRMLTAGSVWDLASAL
jgi:hypothetical protein